MGQQKAPLQALSALLKISSLSILIGLIPAGLQAEEDTACFIPKSRMHMVAPQPFYDIKPTFPSVMGSKVNKGCALISFQLIEKPLSNGKGMIPTKLKIVAASDKPFGTAARAHVSRWLFLASEVKAGKRYVTRVDFERPEEVEVVEWDGENQEGHSDSSNRNSISEI